MVMVMAGASVVAYRAVDGVAQGLLLLLEARLRDLQILEALPLQLLLLLGEVAAQLLAQLVELAQHAVLVLLLELARRLLVGRLRLEELLVEPGVRRLEVAHLRLQLGAHALEHLDLVLHGLVGRGRADARAHEAPAEARAEEELELVEPERRRRARAGARDLRKLRHLAREDRRDGGGVHCQRKRAGVHHHAQRPPRASARALGPQRDGVADEAERRQGQREQLGGHG
mmetsp:Transcript_43578/g.136728  ORF Transcript_43578/g.136728 Transcript_43578/m.136728 type:complete len:229 (-) Transcript_43578:140-826(-)